MTDRVLWLEESRPACRWPVPLRRSSRVITRAEHESDRADRTTVDAEPSASEQSSLLPAGDTCQLWWNAIGGSSIRIVAGRRSYPGNANTVMRSCSLHARSARSATWRSRLRNSCRWSRDSRMNPAKSPNSSNRSAATFPVMGLSPGRPGCPPAQGRSTAPANTRISALRGSGSLGRRYPRSSGPGARSALTRVAARPRERQRGRACRSSRSGRQQAHWRLPQSRQRRAAGVANHNAEPSRAWRCAPLSGKPGAHCCARPP